MKLHSLKRIKKICLFLMKAVSQNRQFPMHWKQFSVRTFVSVLTKNRNSEQKRDGLIPAKIAKRNTTEHQGPKGNFCWTSVPLPTVPPPLLPACIFPFSPLFPVQRSQSKLLFIADFCTYSEAGKIFILFFGGGRFRPHCSSPLNVTAKSFPTAYWKLDTSVS